MKKIAHLYRMVTPEHTCPYGIKALYLLKRYGYRVEDHHLTSREETDAFKQKHNVTTTPQIFINEERIGGHDDLREYLKLPPAQPKGTTYKPVIAVFATTFLMALSISIGLLPNIQIMRTIELFIALSMCVLGILKIKNLFTFSNQFLAYDLLAKRYVPYSYMYPFIETGAGILMIGRIFTWVAAPAALFIGTVGAVSVFKAIYIDKRELKCACVGGNSNVPLGFISFTENIMMVVMSLWMLELF
jgi:glutaredoxin